MDRLRMRLIRFGDRDGLETSEATRTLGRTVRQWQQERAPTRPGKVGKSLGSGIGCWGRNEGSASISRTNSLGGHESDSRHCAVNQPACAVAEDGRLSGQTLRMRTGNDTSAKPGCCCAV